MLNKYYSRKYDKLNFGKMPTFEEIENTSWSRATKNQMHKTKRAMLKGNK